MTGTDIHSGNDCFHLFRCAGGACWRKSDLTNILPIYHSGTCQHLPDPRHSAITQKLETLVTRPLTMKSPEIVLLL